MMKDKQEMFFKDLSNVYDLSYCYFQRGDYLNAQVTIFTYLDPLKYHFSFLKCYLLLGLMKIKENLFNEATFYEI